MVAVFKTSRKKEGKIKKIKIGTARSQKKKERKPTKDMHELQAMKQLSRNKACTKLVKRIYYKV